MRKLSLAIIGAALVLVGCVLAWSVQSSFGSVRVLDVRYPAEDGAVMSGLLYVPKTASEDNPAPGVLVSHGLINTREMQSGFAIELSRRGYVVLAMDQAGHGYSAGSIGEYGYGGPAAFNYLTSLPYVDADSIGLEGHSLGGAPILAAARANPDGYSAMVFEGSSVTIGGRGGGEPFTPRNTAIIFGQFDEFPTMWGMGKGAEVGQSDRMKELFGTDVDVEPGRTYGSIEDGTGRLLELPAVTHPMEHFTNAGIGGAVDWFQRTMPGIDNPLPRTNQVWFWKEIGTLLGFIGCVVLILGVFRAVISKGPLAPLAEEGQPAVEGRGPKWILAFVLSAAIPALTYFWAVENGSDIFMGAWGLIGLGDWAGQTFRQQVTNNIVVWALLNGLIALVLSFVLRGPKAAFSHRWGPALAASVIAVGAGYLSILLADWLFKVDFRFWVLAMKPLGPRQAGFFLLYLLPFTAFFFLALRGFALSIPVKGERTWVAVLVGGLAMSLGFVVLHLVQYGALFSTGELFHNNALYSIVAHQFIPILFVIGVIAALTFRWTNSFVSGAFICALFVTWYVVSGTAVYRAPPTAEEAAAMAAAREAAIRAAAEAEAEEEVEAAAEAGVEAEADEAEAEEGAE